ncbi:hypothetical protein KS4_25770 [Poriferisphaera corsica]|uniref:Glycosyltransferase n=1 Tax=Poriferisphaera corsica TaxID=2528020 RepID=A0A517YWC1_9BACT|nr:TIGR04282 family arsenosugar biosynthesis glycosyltransferase [Poriferisphaera corsica]QDU34507.1 hypothetical protein KS4_25770 [Poriferisphaera corsica]
MRELRNNNAGYGGGNDGGNEHGGHRGRERTGPVRVVLMSKPPMPGAVKTRLAKDTSAFCAARIHQAMLQTMITRLSHLAADMGKGKIELVLALTDVEGMDGKMRKWGDMVTQTAIGTKILTMARCDNPRDDEVMSVTLPEDWGLVDQGTGENWDLGKRLEHVWGMRPKQSVMFLGTDSPDVPVDYLWEAVRRLKNGREGVIGEVSDGGYWTLGMPWFEPELVRGVDWGTGSVYHQTLENAENVNVRLTSLPKWHDVDTLEDLKAMRDRMKFEREPALQQLVKKLDELAGV